MSVGPIGQGPVVAPRRTCAKMILDGRHRQTRIIGCEAIRNVPTDSTLVALGPSRPIKVASPDAENITSAHHIRPPHWMVGHGLAHRRVIDSGETTNMSYKRCTGRVTGVPADSPWPPTLRTTEAVRVSVRQEDACCLARELKLEAPMVGLVHKILSDFLEETAGTAVVTCDNSRYRPSRRGDHPRDDR